MPVSEIVRPGRCATIRATADLRRACFLRLVCGGDPAKPLGRAFGGDRVATAQSEGCADPDLIMSNTRVKL
jgi:hypothetical protein